MTEPKASEQGRVLSDDPYEENREPALVDGIRFLYERRLKLAVRFLAFLGIGVAGFLYAYLSAPKLVQGTIALTFRGIERNEYPTGRKFSVEDFRSPDLLSAALVDAGIANINPKDLSANIFVTPTVPSDIQARWKKQERDGTLKDDYFPNEFTVAIEASEFSSAQRLRFFDALLRNYRERIKYEQRSALSFVAPGDSSYENLATAYDFWDIPSIYSASYRSFDTQLKSLITESLQYPDPKYQLAFRSVSKDLYIWKATRLQALEALTYQGRLVKNRDVMMLRIQYQIEDIDIQIRQKSQEAAEAIQLLGVIDRPNTLLAGQLNNKEGLPIVDASALDKLLKSDYVGPVVSRVSSLQEDRMQLETEKTRLQKQLAWLPKSNNIDIKQLPAGYQDLVQTLSSELRDIIQNYNKLLDEYLTATVSSQVTIKRSPIFTREGYAPTIVLPGIVFLSFILAIFMIIIEHLFAKARVEPTAVRRSGGAK
jgi:hypothetical protein